MIIRTNIDPLAVYIDGSRDLIDDWTIATKSITLTAGTLQAAELTDGIASITGGIVSATKLDFGIVIGDYQLAEISGTIGLFTSSNDQLFGHTASGFAINLGTGTTEYLFGATEADFLDNDIIAGDIFSKTAGVHDLGSGARPWKNLFLSSTIDLGTNRISDGQFTGDWNYSGGGIDDVVIGATTREAGAFTRIGVGTDISATAVINALASYTDTSGSVFAQKFVANIIPASNSTATVFGIQSQPSSFSAFNIGTLISFYGNPKISNTAGIITSIEGFRSEPIKGGASTVSAVYGYRALNAIKSAGTINNLYGMRLSEQTTGNVNWQLYSDGGASFLGGNGTGHGLYFGQTDGNEKVSSDADTTLDFHATTAIHMHSLVEMNAKAVTNLSGVHFNGATQLTISSGAVTVTQGHHSIETEGGAANDDLDTIIGGNAGEILLILPKDDDHTVRLRDGSISGGNIFLKHQVETKSYSFSSPGGASGVFYIAGFYNWNATDANLTQASLSVTHGGDNGGHACHIGIVAGGAGVVDTGVVKITVTGTTIDDDGNRTASQTADLVADITALSLDQYVETSEKWIGTVTIALATASGSPVNFNVDFNYGCTKYEDFGNQSFTVNILESVTLAGANDSGFNIRLFHHNAADWTYATTGFVPGPTAGDASELANMNTDYVTEKNLVNGEYFPYKRVDLNQDVDGGGSEGLVIELTTSANKAIEFLNCHLRVHTAPNFSYMADTKQHLVLMKHGPNYLEL